MQADSALGLGHFLSQSDAVGRTLLVLLLLMSVASWVLMALKGLAQARRRKRGDRFLDLFWNAGTLDQVRHELQTHGAHDPFSHLAAHALHASQHHARYGATRLADAGTASEFITRTMRKVLDEETLQMERGLTLMATVGATAPFVGLFGTVWGIYYALVGVAASGRLSIEKVAGPVGEALIMTAAGIAVAIPGVLAYNVFGQRIAAAEAELEGFAHDLREQALDGRAPPA